ncbi:hypothetical protein BCR35DRAFT_306664 [Leucosporidium creatinivorum]|uniref:Uncharacterized protein n=1 Tax=Leucosporidium creatinivorum TaxID=106004 RepID=A0A1Y2EUJ4_9BASI|nr:hypothetical protein BCR35DRAFT_306664 [Leucosporidium creatinivorum]
MTTPVSLPLTSTLPAPGSTILPSSITSSLPSHALPSHQHSHSHSHSNSFSSVTSLPTNQNNTTRILLLSDFAPELKTRDIQALFEEWEEERGGLKIKWCDDVSCWIVFSDAGVAKRAYLTLLSSPPPALQPSATHTPKLQAYTGPDVPQILSAVQNRPRSRSNAGSGGHSRKGSLAGSGGGSALGQVMGGGGVLGHQRSLSFGRERGARGSNGGSWGQKQMKEMMDAASVNGDSAIGGGDGGDSPPPVPSIPDHLANGGSNSRGSSPVDGRRSPEAYRTTPAFGGAPGSPEQLRRSGGVSPPTVGAGHRRTESRSGTDQVASAVEGLTIAE